MNRKNNVCSAILQPGRKAAAVDIHPVSEMPMVLTLDQFGPNPDNPRTTRNSRYDDIKASVYSRGLDTVPKVTRDPEGENKYIFSDGGNTRYQILRELWTETGEERFYRIHVLFKPWPGRLQCVIGHLVENEIRGELTFIEKAGGVHKARILYEEQLGEKVSMRELSMLLTKQGLPVDVSIISRMENALRYLYPWMPDLLESGLGRPQITSLLTMRQDAEKIWEQFSLFSDSNTKSFTSVFGECCQKFNSPDLWSLEMFRDELVGDLLLALPHPDLNYDRWIMELDPKERNRQYHFGEPSESEVEMPGEIQTLSDEIEEQQENENNHNSIDPVFPDSKPVATSGFSPLHYKEEDDTDISSINADNNDSDEDEALISLLSPYQDDEEDGNDGDENGILTTQNKDQIWFIPFYLDGIEHLQNLAFLIAWDLAEQLGCETEIIPDRQTILSPGYRSATNDCSAPVAFLLSLAGCCPVNCSVSGLDILLIGGCSEPDVAILDDDSAIKLLRLIRIMRRLRDLQRSVIVTQEDADE